MKILHIIKTNTGASWAYKQIKQLNKMGIKIIVMLPNEKDGYAQEYKKIGIKVIPFDASLPIKKPWKMFSKIKEFKRIIKLESPDIIHCHFVTNIMFTRIALRKWEIPRLFQVPGPLNF